MMEPARQSVADQHRTARRRNRAPVSCNHCRARKSKCDRSQPCQSCVRSGDADTCWYVPPGHQRVSHRDGNSNRQSSRPSRNELMSRIDRLEQLVLSAMPNQPQPMNPANIIPPINPTPGGSSSEFSLNGTTNFKNDSDVEQLSKAFGVMKVDPEQVIYLGGAHWVSVLSEINEYRDLLGANHEEWEHDAHEYRASAKASSLFRGTSPPYTLEQLIYRVPPRSVADKLVARYFAFYTSILPIIHETTFRKQYDIYWADPKKTTIMWLALLFGVFNHAIISYDETGEPTSALELGSGNTYKNAAIDCLVAGGFTDPSAHTIEALILCAQAQWVTSQDVLVETSAMLGMIIRLAMRMGIHRDSTAHPEITTFQGEMRRRIWYTILLMDTLYSFQISLPAIIRSDEYDSEFPRNIFDDEFDENTVKLPPSRPLTDITDVSYLIIKGRIILVFQDIIKLTESKSTTSNQDVLKYKQALDDVWKTVPVHFRIHPLEDSISVNLRLKRTRINLDRSYQMAECILHRKFIRPDPAFTQYRRRCIDAALTLLSHQATIYLDSDSGPSIYPQNLSKRHFATLTTHDFFIACMVISIDLHYGFEAYPFNPRPDDIALWGYDRRDDMITALGTSTEFWRVSREESVEAAKAYGIFSFIVERVKKVQSLNAVTRATDLTLDGASTNFSTVMPTIPIDFDDPHWPPEFDLNTWNSWNGDSNSLKTLT